jgi:hypothetical protein
MKTPAGRNGLVLYLDFDGVLHPEGVLWNHKRGAYLIAPPGYALFQHADLLVQLLKAYPTVQIVLSTAWVLRYGVKDTAKRLPIELQQRVIGATFHSRHMNKGDFQTIERGQQVFEDVLRRRPLDWLALDDTNEGWPESHAEHFVQTHRHEGLSDPAVLSVFKSRLARLGGKPGKSTV